MTDGYDGTVTTTDAARLVHVAPATIRSWTTRGLLEPVHKWRGRNVYRVADVFAAEVRAWERDKTGRTKTRGNDTT